MQSTLSRLFNTFIGILFIINSLLHIWEYYQAVLSNRPPTLVAPVLQVDAPPVPMKTTSYETKTNDKETANQWRYFRETDEVTHKYVYYGCVTSTESLNLQFPYSGENYGTLCVQHTMNGKTKIALRIDKGHIITLSSDSKDRYGLLAADHKTAEKVTFLWPKDTDKKEVFFKYPDWGLKKIQNAQTIHLRLRLLHNGEHELVFTPEKPLNLSSMRILPGAVSL